MKTKLLSLCFLLTSVLGGAQSITGSAPVLSSAGRTSCEYVQLWENGPKWAAFNVGATITDYANLTVGADATPFGNYQDQASYYNTANVGGLYAWNQPNYNGRQTTWTSSVTAGVADVATTLWGSNWKTPTYQQLDTLQNSIYGKTTWTWCNGSSTQYIEGCTLKGYKVSGVGAYADKSIFLPAAGSFDYDGHGTVLCASFDGDYWSSTGYDSSNAWYMYFFSGYRSMYYIVRQDGRSVRAVLVESTPATTYTITFVNYDGTTLQSTDVAEGTTPSYTGATPTKPEDAAYTYTFSGWSPSIVAATVATTYTAQFTATGKSTIADGSAEVLSSAGRTSCGWVQLWAGGPKWATFNVGATITDYANLTIGADATPYQIYQEYAPYYNTANVGGLYAWQQPDYNGRVTTYHNVTTGVADVATTLWGSNWKTPTYDDLSNLLSSTYTTWIWCDGSTTQYVPGCTLEGYKVSGVGAYANRSIFLPAADHYSHNNGQVLGAGYNGRYWSSTPSASWAYYLNFYSNSAGMYCEDRRYGRSVRAVLDESTPATTYTITFVNYDGTTLHESEVEEGETPIYTGATPSKSMTMDSVYSFAGWDKEIVAATDDATYTATFIAQAKHSPAPAGVEMVDLGLPSGTLWANMNIGANSPEEYGNYYAWGETEPKSYYDWTNYFDTNDGGNSFNKYNTSVERTLEPEDDAAHVNWGDDWRMPTDDEWVELMNNCTKTYTTINGVSGCRVTGTNGNSIFLPAAGGCFQANLNNVGRYGNYYSSSLSRGGSQWGVSATFWGDSDGELEAFGRSEPTRECGQSIRPVHSAIEVVQEKLEIPVTAGQWHYIAFPVDVDGADIEYVGNGTWGYYNSTLRASGVSGWQNASFPLNANQGYIFYGDQDGTLYVDIDPASLPTANKSIALTDYPSFHVDNENWNFVGNPYYATYNVSNIVPAGMYLYIWNGDGYYYKEAGRDSYNLRPLEAFFVQKKNSESNINFAAASAGAAAPARTWAANSNRYIDIAAVAGGYTDYARVVLNETASMDYTVGYDLAKFFSDEAPIQLFTLDVQSIECGVQELPNGVEEIAIGYTVLESGEVVISTTDMEETYYLYDAETGITTDLRQSNYTFTAEVGTTVNRLSLRRAPAAPTEVEHVDGVNKYVNTPTKVVREGQVLILRGDRIFDLRGQEVQ